MARLASPTSGFKSLPLPLAQLSLAAVLQCGQSFRWSVFPLAPVIADTAVTGLPSHEYRFCLQDRVVCLRQTPEALWYRSVFPISSLPPDEDASEAQTLTWIKDYFQLDVDLINLYEEWSTRDPVFSKLRHRFSGIRMLRQDPFECLLSFICSSNNNIKRITKMVRSLCTEYSSPLVSLSPPDDAILGFEEESYHPFPPPSALAAEDVATNLRKLGFGYRANFIQKTAKMLVENHGGPTRSGLRPEPAEAWLHTLRKMSTVDARTELLKLMGVGRKVADCILLMSMDKREVVPVDTHVHDIAKKHYGLSGSKAKANMTPQLYDLVNAKLAGVWGDYAGWAHSVLFTSDLKAFATYGLPPASPSEPSAVVGTPVREASKLLAATAISSPSPTKKRRKVEETIEYESQTLTTKKGEKEEITLAERVKQRRRTTRTR